MATSANLTFMDSRSWTARAILAALGAFGIAAAHWVTYLLAASGQHGHHELLRSTGHAYWPLGGAVLVALLVSTIGFRLSSRVGFRGTIGVARGSLILAAIQVIGFLVMEVGERILFTPHHSAASLWSEPVLWLGLALQLLVAGAAAFVLRLLVRAVVLVRNWISSSRSADPEPVEVPLHDARIVPPSLSPISSGLSQRGPPLLASI